MDLVLWRHAEAGPGEDDLARKLTSKGEKQSRRIAEWLHGRLPDGVRIYTSPARRSQQTAQALAEVTHRKVRTLAALSPGASPEDVLHALAWGPGKGTVVIVGHQPTLGQIASRLLRGHEAEWPIRKGGLLWITHRLSNGEPEMTSLRAAISPDLT